jgi:dipeptidyl aminopeptidase/acylaminoacyl peptidase
VILRRGFTAAAFGSVCAVVALTIGCAQTPPAASREGSAGKVAAAASTPTPSSKATPYPSSPTSTSESPPASVAETRPVEALALEEALRARLRVPSKTLDIDLAMFGDDFFGTKPEDVRFTDDGRSVVFRWKRFDERRVGIYVHDLATGATTRLPDDDAGPRFGALDRARRRRLVVKGLAVVLESFEAGARETVVATFASRPSDARFDATETAALCVVDDVLWRAPLDAPGLAAVFRCEDGPQKRRGVEDPPTDSRAARLKAELAARERALFRSVHEALEREAAATRPVRRDDVELPVYASPPGTRASIASWSPKGDVVAVRIATPPAVPPRDDVVPHVVTKSGYLETKSARAKAGDAIGETAYALYDISRRAAVVVAPPPEPSGLRLGPPVWSDDGAWCVVEGRSFDREHRLILRVDVATGETTPLIHDRDDAWVLGRGFGFVPGSSLYAFASESTGFRSIHLVDVSTGARRTLGSGGFEVDEPWFSADGSSILAVASIDGPFTREIVRFDVATGEAMRLTADGGLKEIAVSPDGSVLAEVFSKPNVPWELRIRRTDAFDSPRVVTESPSPAFSGYDWVAPPIVPIEGEGGVFYARFFEPKGGARGGPGAVFIHGAGYLQNVHDGWSRYSREYAFHHLLSERGFAVLDIDYRGSSGYGRDFRAAVKGRVGDLDALDVVAAARHLVEREGCDPRRLHCYGGSYGGFLTLMALFKHPGVFLSGAALRPVTDWSHYNEGYCANLLDDPLDDVAVYRAASPITFASGLRDRLLICHGLVDDNVLPHDTIRLAQRLIELRKSDFEVMLYPSESHAFEDPASWSDEYRRILALFSRPPR